jgi:hypothetical protein
MTPSIIKLPVVSPGCCLPNTQITFFPEITSGEEICKRLTSFPPRVVAIVLNLTLDDCDSRAFERNLVRLLYPYGIA